MPMIIITPERNRICRCRGGDGEYSSGDM